MPDPGKGKGNRAAGNDRDPRNLNQIHGGTLEGEGDCAGDSLGHE
ncbi:hypothetical protein [Croceicoccus mobilis]|uniref:Uncharacterized protein n=1 Tax=Croceicoccus mobilis TaxID=1703339 RepID=A0A916Z1K4_9SPHN|nr:hypothetical protein [Croceicoccus mobilis]GGD72227.1 hypothetical protein GCM10010990_22160 [Croceicoccus mobilis]